MGDTAKPEDATVSTPPAVVGGTVSRVSISMRNYFSTHLLWAAQHMAARAGAIEDERGSLSPRFHADHRAFVLSAIIDAVGFFEAAINELFQDAGDNYGLNGDGCLAPLDPRAVATMAQLWQGTNGGTKLRALEKWQLLLTSSGREPLVRGAAPYQDAQLVIQLRNVLIHYRPETVSHDVEHKLSRQLAGRFPISRIATMNPWWPDQCLGHGCALWAVGSLQALADAVSDELGLRLNYRRILDCDALGSPLET